MTESKERIAAKVKHICFRADDYNQTVAEQKLGLKIAESYDPHIYAVIADTMEEAIKMLRYEVVEYLIRCESGSLTTLHSKYFSFTISTAKIVNNKFSMKCWFEHGTEYPVDE